MGRIYQVVVNGMSGEKVIVDLCNTDEQFKNMTVLQLKEKIREKPQVPLPEGGNVRLIFKCKMLEDSELLIAYGIEDMSLINLVGRLLGGGELDPVREGGGMGGKSRIKTVISGTQRKDIFINLFQIDEASLTTEARHQPEK